MISLLKIFFVLIIAVSLNGCGLFRIGLKNAGHTIFNNPDKPLKTEKYPKREFCLIMGGDNVESLPKWKNYELLLQNYDIYVYERPGYNTTLAEDNPRIKIVKDVPMMDISATFIRNAIRDKKSIQYLVPEKVFDYLDGSQMYK